MEATSTPVAWPRPLAVLLGLEGGLRPVDPGGLLLVAVVRVELPEWAFLVSHLIILSDALVAGPAG